MVYYGIYPNTTQPTDYRSVNSKGRYVETGLPQRSVVSRSTGRDCTEWVNGTSTTPVPYDCMDEVDEAKDKNSFWNNLLGGLWTGVSSFFTPRPSNAPAPAKPNYTLYIIIGVIVLLVVVVALKRK